MRTSITILFLLLFFSIWAKAQTREFKPVGYYGSATFRDEATDIVGITLRSGWWIDAIQLKSNSKVFPSRGGTGGGYKEFILNQGERITRVSGTFGGLYGNYIISIQFHTNQRSSPVYGEKRGSQNFNFRIPQGYVFAGFTGRYGQHLNGLGVLYKKEELKPVVITPKLISPINNAKLDNGCSTNTAELMTWNFNWSPIPRASQYHIYVKNDRSSNPLIDQYLTTNRYNHQRRGSYVASHLLYGWKWYVRAKVNGKWTDWSQPRYFSVEPLNSDCGPSNNPVKAPILNAPYANATLDNSCNSGSNPLQWNFNWSRVSGAKQYELYVANRKSSKPLIYTQVYQNYYNHNGRRGSYIADHLLAGWYWKVRTKSANGNWGPWSAERNFNVERVNTDCQPVRIKMKNEGGYVARFKVTYTVNGVSKKWESPNVAVTWKETLNLPSNAKNIMVSAKTVGIGESQIFKVQALGSTCFKVYGTVFSPRMGSSGCD